MVYVERSRFVYIMFGCYNCLDDLIVKIDAFVSEATYFEVTKSKIQCPKSLHWGFDTVTSTLKKKTCYHYYATYLDIFQGIFQIDALFDQGGMRQNSSDI